MEPKLNVCLLNDSFPPLIDGVANAVVNYATVIEEKLGHSMVATPSYPQANDNYSFPVYRYPSINTTKIVGYRTGYPFDYTSVSGIDKEHVDIIHSHCPFVSTVMARILRQSVNAPIVFTYHTKFDIDIEKAIKSNTIQTAAIKIIAANIASCDEVWSVSNGAGQSLRKIGYTGDFVVMENGVDFPNGRVSDEKIAEISRMHGLEENTAVFLFVGRMMWYKGVRISLDGLKKAMDNGEKFRMILIGEGQDKEEMEEYAKQLGIYERCIFTGAIRDRELLRAYFCRADLFLFPSTYDTNGIVVREAAACGLPSVLIENSCASEGVIDGRNGILIQENSESMGEAIIYACKHLCEIKTIGEHAMNELYMSWEESVYRAYQRYQIVIENKKRTPATVNEQYKELFYTAVADMYMVREKIQANTEKVKDKIESGTDKVKDKVQIGTNKVKIKVQHGTNKVKRSVKRNTRKIKIQGKKVQKELKKLGSKNIC